VFRNVLPVLSSLDIPVTIFVPTGFLGQPAGWCTLPDGRAERVASARALLEVDSNAVRFGSHTVTHPRLANLTRSELQNELSDSKQALEQIVGRPIQMLAFPFGSFNAETVDMAGLVGYRQLFANVPVRSSLSQPTLIGRINATPNDWTVESVLKVFGAYDWMAYAVALKRTLRHRVQTVRFAR
jgi:peptidoglycan/xylan/chitin deacetylase (PgdA/CDA1 family)